MRLDAELRAPLFLEEAGDEGDQRAPRFVATRVLAELAALGSLSPSDRNDRDIALASIQAAQGALLAGDHEAAIAQLLTATARLLKITSANVLPQRVDTARLLQDAQIRWTGTQP